MNKKNSGGGTPGQHLRPNLREKMMTWGADQLSDSELLALVLGVGSAQERVESLAWRLIHEKGGLAGLVNSDVHELTAIPGVGRAKAARIAGILTLARRLSRGRGEGRPQMCSGLDIYKLVAADLVNFPQERFLVLSLDGKNRLLRLDVISLGTAKTAVVHPRDVFIPAVNSRAISIVVVHNHPSGDPAPSREDLELTERLRRGGELLGLEVLDHVIVGAGRFISLAESPTRVQKVD